MFLECHLAIINVFLFSLNSVQGEMINDVMCSCAVFGRRLHHHEQGDREYSDEAPG